MPRSSLRAGQRGRGLRGGHRDDRRPRPARRPGRRLRPGVRHRAARGGSGPPPTPRRRGPARPRSSSASPAPRTRPPAISHEHALEQILTRVGAARTVDDLAAALPSIATELRADDVTVHWRSSDPDELRRLGDEATIPLDAVDAGLRETLADRSVVQVLAGDPGIAPSSRRCSRRAGGVPSCASRSSGRTGSSAHSRPTATTIAPWSRFAIRRAASSDSSSARPFSRWSTSRTKPGPHRPADRASASQRSQPTRYAVDEPSSARHQAAPETARASRLS